MQQGQIRVPVQNSTTIVQILQDPRLVGVADVLGLVQEGSSITATLRDLYREQPAFRYAGIEEGLDAALRRAEGNPPFHIPLYSNDEISENSLRSKAGLFYFPCEDPHAPFALVVPGGAYAMVATAIEGFPTAAKLSERGINAFVLTYRASYPPAGGSLTDSLEDVRRALRYVLENAAIFGLNPNDYAVVGFSAGGHLASMLGTDTYGYSSVDLPRPGLIGLVYPVVSFDTGGVIDICRSCAFGEISSAEERNRAYAPHHISSDCPPLFLVHGKNDDTVPFELNAPVLYYAAKEKGVSCRMKTYEDFPHGAGIGSGLTEGMWLAELVDFWETGA